MMFTVNVMQPSTKRLYDALRVLLVLDEVGSTLAAKTLGLASAQTVNNWEERGVSKAGVVSASKACGIRPSWIELGELPMFEPKSINHYDTTPPPALLATELSPHQATTDKIAQALDVIEVALSQLDMRSRERIAPMFESFARSPGAIIKADITAILERKSDTKSEAMAA